MRAPGWVLKHLANVYISILIIHCNLTYFLKKQTRQKNDIDSGWCYNHRSVEL